LSPTKEIVDASQTYIDLMKEISRQRVTVAGYRLALWLDFFAGQQD
jgi:hypothetical protein